MVESVGTRIALVDDHALFRHGLAELLGKESDFEIVASTAAALSPAAVRAARPDLVLLDCDLLGTRTVDLIEEFLKLSPGLRVIVLSMYDDPGLVDRLVASGARGFMLKSTSREELLATMRAIAQGTDRVVLTVSQNTLRRMHSLPEQVLSAREIEVLELLALGLRNSDIAANLFIAEGTVKRHLTNIYGKLEVRSRVEALKQAVLLGLVPFPEQGER
jgi:DNA-binding NarL/FixJ family response regulator